MNCELLNLAHGSEAWERAQWGRVSSSRIGSVLAKPSTKRYQAYHTAVLAGMRGERPDLPPYNHSEQLPRALEALSMNPRAPIRRELIRGDVFAVDAQFAWLCAPLDGLVSELYIVHCTIREKLDRYQVAIQRPPSLEVRRRIQAALYVTKAAGAFHVEYYEDETIRKVWVRGIKPDPVMQCKLISRATDFFMGCLKHERRERGEDTGQGRTEGDF